MGQGNSNGRRKTVARKGKSLEMTADHENPTKTKVIKGVHYIFNIHTDRKLGHGTFSVLYHADNITKREKVCVKKLTYYALSEVDEDYEFKKDFNSRVDFELQCLRLCAKAKHSNVVAYIDHCQRKENYWIFMEECRGGDLHNYIKHRGTRLTKTFILSIMQQTGSAVAFMHRTSEPFFPIVHRDIKLKNFLVQPGSSASVMPVIKLSDFGLARQFTSKNSTDESAMASIAGTPSFMGPEFYSGSQTTIYGPSVDIFALGLVYTCIVNYDGDERDLVPMCRIMQETETVRYYGRTIARFLNHDEAITEIPEIIKPALAKELCITGDVTSLIKQMIHPRPSQRINAQQILQKIKEIVHKFETPTFTDTLVNYPRVIPEQSYTNESPNERIPQQNAIGKNVSPEGQKPPPEGLLPPCQNISSTNTVSDLSTNVFNSMCSSQTFQTVTPIADDRSKLYKIEVFGKRHRSHGDSCSYNIAIKIGNQEIQNVENIQGWDLQRLKRAQTLITKDGTKPLSVEIVNQDNLRKQISGRMLSFLDQYEEPLSWEITVTCSANETTLQVLFKQNQSETDMLSVPLPLKNEVELYCHSSRNNSSSTVTEDLESTRNSKNPVEKKTDEPASRGKKRKESQDKIFYITDCRAKTAEKSPENLKHASTSDSDSDQLPKLATANRTSLSHIIKRRFSTTQVPRLAQTYREKVVNNHGTLRKNKSETDSTIAHYCASLHSNQAPLDVANTSLPPNITVHNLSIHNYRKGKSTAENPSRKRTPCIQLPKSLEVRVLEQYQASDAEEIAVRNELQKLLLNAMDEDGMQEWKKFLDKIQECQVHEELAEWLSYAWILHDHNLTRLADAVPNNERLLRFLNIESSQTENIKSERKCLNADAMFQVLQIWRNRNIEKCTTEEIQKLASKLGEALKDVDRQDLKNKHSTPCRLLSLS